MAPRNVPGRLTLCALPGLRDAAERETGMRVAIAFGLLVAAVAADAKPVDAEASDARPSAQAMRFRMEGVAACIAAHRPDGAPRERFVVQNCQCAVDRFAAGRNPADL